MGQAAGRAVPPADRRLPRRGLLLRVLSLSRKPTCFVLSFRSPAQLYSKADHQMTTRIAIHVAVRSIPGAYETGLAVHELAAGWSFFDSSTSVSAWPQPLPSPSVHMQTRRGGVRKYGREISGLASSLWHPGTRQKRTRLQNLCFLRHARCAHGASSATARGWLPFRIILQTMLMCNPTKYRRRW